MFLFSSSRCLCPIHWSKVLSREWRYSSADGRCSNYIWMIKNFIAYQCAAYIKGFIVFILLDHNLDICSWYRITFMDLRYIFSPFPLGYFTGAETLVASWYIKNNACVTVNTDFWVTGEAICQWFSRVTKSGVKIIGKSHHEWPNNRYLR